VIAYKAFSVGPEKWFKKQDIPWRKFALMGLFDAASSFLRYTYQNMTLSLYPSSFITMIIIIIKIIIIQYSDTRIIKIKIKIKIIKIIKISIILYLKRKCDWRRIH
jgi:hypothetical protein